MRLIDADLLKQNCKCTGGFKDNFMCVDLITLAQVIDNQPTAFDVDKVVEQLEKYRENFESRGILPLVNMDYAVKVVRNGRKE